MEQSFTVSGGDSRSKNVTILTITDDFSLQKIAESGQCFRWSQAADGSWRVIAADRCVYLSELGQGRYRLEGCAPADAAFWTRYLDLDERYAAIRQRIDPKKDPFLSAAAEHERGIRILRQDAWEMLITAIITQNRNIPAIQRSVALLAALCGKRRLDSRGLPYHAFPAPAALAALSEDQLKACKLGYRWKYIRAAAEAVAEGRLSLEALKDVPCGEAVQALTRLYGIGEKVASCVALFGLHQLDAFPVDVWMKRIMAEHYARGYPFEAYSPYNGVCQQYMFAYYRTLFRPRL